MKKRSFPNLIEKQISEHSEDLERFGRKMQLHVRSSTPEKKRDMTSCQWEYLGEVYSKLVCVNFREKHN